MTAPVSDRARKAVPHADDALLRGLLEESWHFVKAIEEYECEHHTQRWQQSLDLRKRIDAALASEAPPAAKIEGDAIARAALSAIHPAEMRKVALG